jgi:hypothetical protein
VRSLMVMTARDDRSGCETDICGPG